MDDRSLVRLTADTRLRGVAGPLPARTYWPSRGDTPDGGGPLVVFLPAAGIDRADRLCRAVCASAGLVVMSVAYRKPAWPYGRCDAILATGWAADHAGELGVTADHLLLAGDGDGAMLAVAVASHAYEQRWPPLLRVSVDELLDGARHGGRYVAP